MSLHRRVVRLAGRLPGPQLAGVPTDPVELLTGLTAGTARLADLDRTDADQVSAVAYVAALLTTRMPVEDVR